MRFIERRYSLIVTQSENALVSTCTPNPVRPVERWTRAALSAFFGGRQGQVGMDFLVEESGASRPGPQVEKSQLGLVN